MTRLKLILLTLIILCLGTFIVLNTQTVELNLLFAKVNMSRSVILLLVLAAGFVLGWISRSLATLRAKLEG
tara:strand:- start:5283 stop:5495 length:213 start_codon:yes stop_codon:yes gene_type:complete